MPFARNSLLISVSLCLSAFAFLVARSLGKEGTAIMLTDLYIALMGNWGKVNPFSHFWKLMGVAATILAAFVALAGAAWSLDFPDVLSLALFSIFYYSLFYLYLFFEIQCSVYARTIEFIYNLKEKEEESIDFFLQIGFLLASFGIFLYSYSTIYPDIDDDSLVNPLQVVAQLSCFFFHFKLKRGDVRQRHLILLCFLLSIICTVYLKEIHF